MGKEDIKKFNEFKKKTEALVFDDYAAAGAGPESFPLECDEGWGRIYILHETEIFTIGWAIVSDGAKMHDAYHWHPQVEIITQIVGICRIRANGETITLHPTQSLAVPRNQGHESIEYSGRKVESLKSLFHRASDKVIVQSFQLIPGANWITGKIGNGRTTKEMAERRLAPAT